MVNLAAMVEAMIEDGRQTAAISMEMETASALDQIIRSVQMRYGQVARSGARSHAVWRATLSHQMMTSALYHAMAAAQFAVAAGVSLPRSPCTGRTGSQG